MIARYAIPVFRPFTWLAAALVVLLTAMSGAEARPVAATPPGQSAKTVPAQTEAPIRLAQSISRGTFSQNFVRTPTTGGNNRPSGGKGSSNHGGDRRRPSGGGVSIGIDLNGLLNTPGAYKPPRRTPSRKVYRKPATKKVYRKPPPKKTNTARRTPPRRAVPALQPIPQFFPDQVTVLIQDQPDATEDEIAQAFGLTKLSAAPVTLLEGRVVTYRIPQGATVPQVVAQLTADPRVALAQTNNIYLTVQQRSSANSASAQYTLAKLALTPAHRIAQGRDVAVAVIDTGVDTSHPVLARAVSESFDAVQDGAPEPQDHGTAIAGLIAGQGRVKGVAPMARLLPVRAFYMHEEYNRPVTSSAILLRGLDWAYASGARVFNMSFAGPFDPLVKAALTSAHDKGVILVAAAGNGGPKAAPAYPAAYGNVLAITALDNRDRLYAHANRGKYLTAAAPGVDVLVPALKKGYTYSSGTSMAAAHVSGLVALLLERKPDADTRAIRDAVVAGAHDLGPKGPDVEFGAGRADAHASLMSLTATGASLASGQ